MATVIVKKEDGSTVTITDVSNTDYHEGGVTITGKVNGVLDDYEFTDTEVKEIQES